MRRNRRNNGKKERIIMIASSVFVLSALTLTGIYLQSENAEPEDDGYTIDLEALRNSADDKSQEIAENLEQEGVELSENTVPGGIEDDLDYMPPDLEAGTNQIEIPGLTDGISEQTEKPGETEKPINTGKPGSTQKPDGTSQPAVTPENNGQQVSENQQVEQAPEDQQEEQAPEEQQEEQTLEEQQAAAEPADWEQQPVAVSRELHFAEADGLLRPLDGEVLLPFSMDRSIYFSTLEHYKYNPALILQAEEGTAVAACAEGKVVNVFEDAEIGNAVTMELGDGYEITYGQLKEINVTSGSYVESGETIGKVAAPTKYFSIEGANLYLKLTAAGTPVDPEKLFR